jgi:hypothetical protein
MDKDFNKLLYEKTKQDYILQLIRQISQPTFNKKNLSKTDLEYWDETCELIYQQKIFLEQALLKANQEYKELLIKKTNYINPSYMPTVYYKHDSNNPYGIMRITESWDMSWGRNSTE